MRGRRAHSAYWSEANTGVFSHHNHIAMERQIRPPSHAVPMHLRNGWDAQIPEHLPASYGLFHAGNITANRAGRLRCLTLWRRGDVIAGTERTASPTDDYSMDARISLGLLGSLEQFGMQVDA